MDQAYSITEQVTLVTMSCGKCGISFAMPDFKRDECINSKENFYCPNGHPRMFRESEADRLRKQLDEQVREATRQLQARIEAEAKLAKAERKLKRVSKGTCPECNRSFTNLARHMACKHTVSA